MTSLFCNQALQTLKSAFPIVPILSYICVKSQNPQRYGERRQTSLRKGPPWIRTRVLLTMTTIHQLIMLALLLIEHEKNTLFRSNYACSYGDRHDLSIQLYSYVVSTIPAVELTCYILTGQITTLVLFSVKGDCV